MLAFIIFIIGPILVALYIIRDEIRRARDKRSGALVKRLPRTEPWVWSIYLYMFGALSLYVFTHPEKFELIYFIFAIGSLIFGLIGMYYYETKYLRFNPDNTITYRGLTGKLRTTPITAINEYQYTREAEHPHKDGTDPDSIWLWNDKGYTIAAYSPRGMKEYTPHTYTSAAPKTAGQTPTTPKTCKKSPGPSNTTPASSTSSPQTPASPAWPPET